MTEAEKMKSAKIFIDESGFKSKSKNITNHDKNNICLFVGVIIPQTVENFYTFNFQVLFDKFKTNIPSDMKLHITDAFASQDPNIRKLVQEVRGEYLKIFKKTQGKYLFGAKRASIEKKSFDFTKSWLENMDKSRTNTHLKISHPHFQQTLEGKAFESLIGKMEAFAEEFGFDEVIPLFDEIDTTKQEEYQKILNRFRNINNTQTITATAWDTQTNRVVKASGQVRFEVENFEIENRVADIQVIGKNHPLILLADILANYTHNYMKSLPPDTPLHAPSSYKNFDLYPHIYGLTNDWLDDIR